MSRTPRLPVLFATALALFPSVLLAQACIGVPAGNGQVALSGGAGFTEGVKSYGAEAAFNLVGPVSLEAGYSLVTFDDIDNNGNTVSGSGAFELPVPGLSVCPAAGVSHMRWSERFELAEVTLTSTIIPVGMGVGRELPAGPNLFVTLFAVPQFLHVRGTISGSEGGASVSVSDSTNEFGTALGMRLGSDEFYVGAGVNLTTIEGSDPTFGVTMGLVLGS